MKNIKRTFGETLKNLAQENSEKLMAKARTANRLAKLLKGKNRKIAYTIKAESLRSLVKSFPNKTKICKDLQLTNFVIVGLKNTKSGLHLPIEKLQGI